jgi:hypothetical protein
VSCERHLPGSYNPEVPKHPIANTSLLLRMAPPRIPSVQFARNSPLPEQNQHSNPIKVAASAANASGSLQTALSKVPGAHR